MVLPKVIAIDTRLVPSDSHTKLHVLHTGYTRVLAEKKWNSFSAIALDWPFANADSM